MNETTLPPAVRHEDRALALASLCRLDVHVFRAPIDTPVQTSFGTMTDRPAVLVRLEDVDGACGWGEIWCNFPACGAEHRALLTTSVLAPLLLGRAHRSPQDASGRLARETRILALQTREFGPLAQAIAGVDVALWDLAARRAGEPLWRFLGDCEAPGRIPVYASGINPTGAENAVRDARSAGFRAFKVKIGFAAERDLAVVNAITEDLGADEHLMVDANQGWSPTQAHRMMPALAAAGVDWLEEPLPVDTPAGAWRALARSAPVPLAGGENLADDNDFRAAIDAGYLSVIQPDVCKWGGISRCVPIARYALSAGLRYCPHYLGAGIGLLASGHALATVGGDGLLEVDVNPNPLREALAQPFPTIQAGHVTLSPTPGLGVEPDLPAVRRWRTLHRTETR